MLYTSFTGKNLFQLFVYSKNCKKVLKSVFSFREFRLTATVEFSCLRNIFMPSWPILSVHKPQFSIITLVCIHSLIQCCQFDKNLSGHWHGALKVLTFMNVYVLYKSYKF